MLAIDLDELVIEAAVECARGARRLPKPRTDRKQRVFKVTPEYIESRAHPISLSANDAFLVNKLIAHVAKCYGLSQRTLCSRSKADRLVEPRQVAMWMASKIGGRYLSIIGRPFDRDHTTVLYAINKIEALMHSDNRIRWNVEAVLRSIEIIPDVPPYWGA